MRLVGARAGAVAQPEEQLAGYTNYLLDSDPRNWRTHVPNYRRVRYRNVYPGIDVVYYGNPRELEFDFFVTPGADPRRIRLALSDPDLRIRLPRAYQGNRTIGARAVRHDGTVTFALAAYDRSRPLVIDPVLSFATIFGGGGFDEGRAIAVDSTGASYVSGTAGSGNFPVVNGKPGQFSFLAKVNPAGEALVYSTYLPFSPVGGPPSFAIDSSGSAYFATASGVANVSGLPGSSGPPVIGPAPLHDCGSTGPPHIYVGRVSPDGASMIYSGCIGGSSFETPGGIAVDTSGNAYVVGFTQSADFPLANPLSSSPSPASQGPPRSFVLKLGPNGALLFSTFFGGNGDLISAIAADPAGNIYLTGRANSPDFPLQNAMEARPQAGGSAFVAKINAESSDLVYSTYFGGSDISSAPVIAADASGNAFIAGSTTSGNLRTTSNAFQSKFAGVFAYKSTDGGSTWSQSDFGLPGGVSTLRIDSRNPSNLYVISSGRIYRSIDSGATWQSTAATPAGGLWINPADSTLYAAVTNSGPGRGVTQTILRSRDRGATFAAIDTGLRGSLNQMVFDPTNASLIYARFGGAGVGDGIYKSTDGGDTWTTGGLNGGGTGQGGLAIDPANPSTLYASTRRGLMRSEDGGVTWDTIGGLVDQVFVDRNSTLYSTTGNLILVLGATVPKTAPGPIRTLSIDPADSSIWYVVVSSSTAPFGTGNSLYKSTDSGDHWQSLRSGLPDTPNIAALAIDPGMPATVYLGASASPDGFLSKLSPDGSSLLYSTYFGGNGSESVTSIATDAAGNTYIAGSKDSADFPLLAPFRTPGSPGIDGFVARFDSSNTLTWSSPLGGATPRAIVPGRAGEVYLTGSASSADFPTAHSIQPYISSNFFSTADRGTTWTASSPTAGAPPQPPFFTPYVAADPKTPSRVYALADRLYVSNDRGQNWMPLGTPAGTQGPPFFGPFAATVLVLDPLTPTTMYAAGICQSVPNGPPLCGVSKSTNGGANWAVNAIGPSGNNGPPAFASGLAIDPKTPSILYASTSSGIFKSTDSGATWNAILSVQNGAAVALDPRNSGVLYASFGTNTGSMFKTADAGANWATINTGLPSGWYARVLVTDLAVPGRVYAGGSFPSPGLYRTDNGGSNWTKVGSGLPDGSINALVLDPSAPATVYAAPLAGGLYRSADAGATFTPLPGLRIPLVNSIAIDPTNSSRIYTGTQFNSSDAFVMKIVP
jgi:photosystem II stability/assembly factor-like uncharacterized protein